MHTGADISWVDFNWNLTTLIIILFYFKCFCLVYKNYTCYLSIDLWNLSEFSPAENVHSYNLLLHSELSSISHRLNDRTIYWISMQICYAAVMFDGANVFKLTFFPDFRKSASET